VDEEKINNLVSRDRTFEAWFSGDFLSTTAEEDREWKTMNDASREFFWTVYDKDRPRPRRKAV